MATEYLKPFVEGVQELVSTMLQSPCEVTETEPIAQADVSGVISLDGETTGQIALSFSRETATRMVAQLLALDETEVDDDILGDGVGEFANIVAGMAKGRLSICDHRIKLSLPSIVVESDHTLEMFRESDVSHVRLVTSYGEFSLRVWFPARNLLGNG